MTMIVMNNPAQQRDQMVIPPVPVDEPVIKNTAFSRMLIRSACAKKCASSRP